MSRPAQPVPPAVAARDRVQHLIVAAIAARQRRRPRLVFKGGTLLRSCWREDYRYSEDLDFDWLDPSGAASEDLGLFLHDALAGAARSGRVDLELRVQRGRMAVVWADPRGTSGVLRVDARRRDHPSYVAATRDWYLRRRYEDVPTDTPILGYTLDAVLAAKLACLAEPRRAAPRDFYDVNELLRSGEVDAARAVQAFLDLRYPDSAGRPSLSQLDELILGPGYEHFDVLESEWAKSAAQGLVPAAGQDLAAIFEGVETQLATALTDLDPPTDLGIDV